jgi:signal transduction histidine kinase
MTERKPAWERFGDAMLDWGGYFLLVVSTVLVLVTGDPAAPGLAVPEWRLISLALAVTAGLWIYLFWWRTPQPRLEHRARMRVFFVGLLVLGSILMLRHPLNFVFMISGFFYATALRPMPLTVVGIGATSVLINTLIAGFPQTPEGWIFYVVIIAIQTTVIGAGVVVGEQASEQSEQRRRAVERLNAALEENAGLHAQLVTQAREAGVLEERGRMAREIHDTIAQGLTGIITQLEAADQSRERPADRDRHLEHAKHLARESLAEARRSVEASLPGALEAGTLPEALAGVAGEWSERSGIPADVTVTGDPIRLHPDIEVALLRTAQEALANVAKHARASRVGLTLSFMGDVVTLDVRDDGVGFSVPDRGSADGSGFGLAGMRQRVARVAGSVAIESEPGAGTAVSARVPAIAAPVGAP